MSEPDLDESEFLALIRSLEGADIGRAERLLAGVLSGRITLTLDEASRLRPGDVVALADALPADAPKDWQATRGPH